MTVKLVQIGNSKGIRIPKAILQQANLEDEVNLRVEGNRVIIESARHPRAGWEEQMKKAVAEHGAELSDEDREWLEAPLNGDWDEKEWKW